MDDHEIVRQGLVALLDRREGFAVVAEAGTVAEAVEQAERHHPDIVVMDVRLPDGSGIEACREIRAEMPETKVVMLTSYPDEEAVLSAIVAGASGYLLKQIRARDLVAALEAVGRGESLLDPAVTEKVLERIRRIATGSYADELAALTPQEQKILLLVAEGMTNKEIAAEVFLSDKTVKNYVSSILAKLNLERRAQAAAFVANRRTGGMPPAAELSARARARGPASALGQDDHEFERALIGDREDEPADVGGHDAEVRQRERDRALDLDLAIGETRLGGDLDRLRDTVQGQVADQREVGRGPVERRGRHGDGLGQREGGGREPSVWSPSLRNRLSRRASSDRDGRGVDRERPLGEGRGRPVGRDLDRAGHLVRPTDRFRSGREARELLGDAVAGLAAGPDGPGPGDVAVEGGRGASLVDASPLAPGLGSTEPTAGELDGRTRAGVASPFRTWS